MVMRGISDQGKTLVFAPGCRPTVRRDFPERNLETGNFLFFENRTHIRRQLTKILGNKTVLSRFLHDHAEQPVALLAIPLAALLGRIVAGHKTRQEPAGARLGLFLAQRQEFFVAVRTPRETVNAEEPQSVVDAQEVENFHRGAKASTPPRVVVLCHFLPMIKWKTPILTPLGGKRVGRENFFRRRAGRTREVENLRLGKDVRTENTHPHGHIADQGHLPRLAVSFQLGPLTVSHPLHVGEEVAPGADLALVHRRGGGEPLLGGRVSALFFGPKVGVFVLAMPADQGAEQSVRFQPCRIFLAPRGKLSGPPRFLFDLPRLEIFPRRLEQFALQGAHSTVIHFALAQRAQIMLGADFFVIRG